MKGSAMQEMETAGVGARIPGIRLRTRSWSKDSRHQIKDQELRSKRLVKRREYTWGSMTPPQELVPRRRSVLNPWSFASISFSEHNWFDDLINAFFCSLLLPNTTFVRKICVSSDGLPVSITRIRSRDVVILYIDGQSFPLILTQMQAMAAILLSASISTACVDTGSRPS